MNTSPVRIAAIDIHNFKNVGCGSVTFGNNKKRYQASLLGLYGQNGSGKTALIDSIELLQHILCGREVPSRFVDYISVDADYASFAFEFQIKLPEGTESLSYEFSIKGVEDEEDQNINSTPSSTKKRILVFNEVIKCLILSERKSKKGRLIDTSGQEAFIPKTKRILLAGSDIDVLTSLLVAKKMSASTSRSYIFSKLFLDIIRNKVRNDQNEGRLSQELNQYYQMIEALVDYGNHGLFVVNARDTGLISLNALPFVFKYEEGNIGAQGKIMLPLEEPVVIFEEQKALLEKIILNMNIVLKQIIPGLTISLMNHGSQILPDGQSGAKIQLMSQKNKRTIPLKYESEGIKKIISVLQLLIVVYNQESITVAIDELDAGVFEYLLGELMRIISEKGKGQLIFTSHNLRPLETLDRGFIAFTTTNPHHRYVRMTGVKENNNLRDFYYRDIMLGEQDEELYETTKNSEIALAFREAGAYLGS